MGIRFDTSEPSRLPATSPGAMRRTNSQRTAPFFCCAHALEEARSVSRPGSKLSMTACSATCGPTSSLHRTDTDAMAR